MNIFWDVTLCWLITGVSKDRTFSIFTVHTVLTTPENKNLSTIAVKTSDLTVAYLYSDFLLLVPERCLTTLKSFKYLQFTTVKATCNETARDGIFSIAGRFCLIQVLAIWILRFVTLFHSRQVYFMTRVCFRQVCNSFRTYLMFILMVIKKDLFVLQSAWFCSYHFRFAILIVTME
jgi:hypothetical protein